MITAYHTSTHYLHRSYATEQFARRVKQLVFYAVFYTVFCLSGILSLLGLKLGFTYRMAVASVLVAPIILMFGVRFNGTVYAYLALAAVVVTSGVLNGSKIADIVLFMRNLVQSYSMYRLASLYVHKDNAHRVLRQCVTVGMLQLPVILVQRLVYDLAPWWIRAQVHRIDIGFGTFNLKCDASMSFFIVLLVAQVLFNKRIPGPSRYRSLVLLWLTLTALVSNAQVMKLALLLVWGFYVLTHVSPRVVVMFSLMVLLIAVSFHLVGFLRESLDDFRLQLATNRETGLAKQRSFFAGGYGRGAAVRYYMSRGILWIGDGPSRYYSVLTQTRLLGNTAHFLTFYSEVGLLGWVGSILVFFLMLVPTRSSERAGTNGLNLIVFIALQVLSLTTQVMSDVSVVLSYSIFTTLTTVNCPSAVDLGCRDGHAPCITGGEDKA